MSGACPARERYRSLGRSPKAAAIPSHRQSAASRLHPCSIALSLSLSLSGSSCPFVTHLKRLSACSLSPSSSSSSSTRCGSLLTNAAVNDLSTVRTTTNPSWKTPPQLLHLQRTLSICSTNYRIRFNRLAQSSSNAFARRFDAFDPLASVAFLRPLAESSPFQYEAFLLRKASLTIFKAGGCAVSMCFQL